MKIYRFWTLLSGLVVQGVLARIKDSKSENSLKHGGWIKMIYGRSDKLLLILCLSANLLNLEIFTDLDWLFLVPSILNKRFLGGVSFLGKLVIFQEILKSSSGNRSKYQKSVRYLFGDTCKDESC